MGMTNSLSDRNQKTMRMFGKKVCSECHRLLPGFKFGLEKGRPDRRSDQCLDCKPKQEREYEVVIKKDPVSGDIINLNELNPGIRKQWEAKQAKESEARQPKRVEELSAPQPWAKPSRPLDPPWAKQRQERMSSTTSEIKAQPAGRVKPPWER